MSSTADDLRRTAFGGWPRKTGPSQSESRRSTNATATSCGATFGRLGIREEAADDAMQDVFLVVHRRLSDFESRSSVRTWLFGIVLRVAQTHLRTVRRRRVHVDDERRSPSSSRSQPARVKARQRAVGASRGFALASSPPRRARRREARHFDFGGARADVGPRCSGGNEHEPQHRIFAAARSATGISRRGHASSQAVREQFAMNGLDNHARAILDAARQRGRSNLSPARANRARDGAPLRIRNRCAHHDDQRLGGAHHCQGVDPGHAGGGRWRGGRGLVRGQATRADVDRGSGRGNAETTRARDGRQRCSRPNSDEPGERRPRERLGPRRRARLRGSKERRCDVESSSRRDRAARRSERCSRRGSASQRARSSRHLRSTLPNGMLREESSATRVVALCQLEHGPRASALAKRFLSQHASSPTRTARPASLLRPDPVKAQGRCALLLAAIAVSAGCRAGLRDVPIGPTKVPSTRRLPSRRQGRMPR